MKENSQSLLNQAVIAAKQTQRVKTVQMLEAFAGNILEGVIVPKKTLSVSLREAIKKIDAFLSKQLVKIMHHPEFKKLEGSWRGLNYLIKNSETGGRLKIKIFNVKKQELFKDLENVSEFDQSQLFKKVYENEFGMPGGEPYGLMIGDYELTYRTEDVQLLKKISQVSAAAFCPFVAAAGAPFFGFDGWKELSRPRDLETLFDSPEYIGWRSFRESDDSRFVALTLPRVLARLPYGAASNSVYDFNYEEADSAVDQSASKMNHDDYCWMNAAYVLGTRITEAFSKYGWTIAIRGFEGGGRVENLPLHHFLTDEGDIDSQCPTEIGITDRRELELSKLGFLPLCHYKNTDYAVFFGGQTTQKMRKYDRPEATDNAAISARLPYILATSRFAHYLKVMARDKIGSFLEASDCENWLNRWINNYVNANVLTNQELKAKYPLAEAKIEVKEIPGRPGAYHAVAWLRPWLQFEELTASLRLVARIPRLKN